MSILILPDVVLSNQVMEAGVRGRQIRRNQRVRTANGVESINVVWDRTIREYDLGTVPLRRSAWEALESLFEVTDAGAYGFLMMDPKDSSAGTGGRVALVPGETSVYQLFKRYVEPVSGRYKDRKITRPRASTVVVSVSGVATDATVDGETGRVTIESEPTATDVTWTGSFYVPVHFLNDRIDWSMVVAGPTPDGRFLTGPTVTLQEVLE